MPGCRRRRFAAAAAAVVICAQVTLQAQAQEDPYTRVKVIRNGVLNKTLPFDVPFIIWGDVPADVETVTVLYAELESGADCSADLHYRRLPTQANAETWTDRDYTDRGLTAPSDESVSDTRQFEMVIPLSFALAPSRRYCFLFQQGPGQALSPHEVETLGERLLPAYQAFLRDTGGRLRRGVAAGEVEPLRQKLIQDLLAAVRFQSLTPEARSVFDPNAAPAMVDATFVSLFDPVTEQHTNVVGQVDLFEGRSGPARNDGREVPRRTLWLRNWRAWSDTADFSKLLATLSTEQQATAPSLAEVDGAGRARLLLGLPASGSDDLLRDVGERDPSVTEEPSTDPNAIKATPCPKVQPLAGRCRQIEGTRIRIEDLAAAARREGLTDVATAMDRTVQDLTDQKSTLLTIQRTINQRHAAMEDHIEELRGRIPTEWHAVVTTDGSLATRQQWYTSADVGLAIALNEVFPYAGANFYFRPVNSEAPLRMSTRISALLGLTWTENVLKEGERGPLYGKSTALVVGLGLRLTEVLKVGVGVLVFKGLDPNPLLDRPKIRVAPMFNMALDLDVGGILSGLFGEHATPPGSGSGTN